ncbi:MAG: hypothetical protein ACPH09_05405, partial [Pseudomonadales bacterium]
ALSFLLVAVLSARLAAGGHQGNELYLGRQKVMRGALGGREKFRKSVVPAFVSQCTPIRAGLGGHLKQQSNIHDG